MTLREITISGLYGYIDKHIEFHRDINLLVGINGSGKTSILNIISWMLNPAALPNLCLTQFSEVSLKITYKTVNYELVCKKKSKQMTFHITREGVKSKSFHPLEIPLFQLPEGFAAAAESRKAALERYSGMKPNKKELPAFTLWQEIPKAVILGLDRTVSRESKTQDCLLVHLR
jgi:energy-coupling factor transporter ATP-binding protein EcfA2